MGVSWNGKARGSGYAVSPVGRYEEAVATAGAYGFVMGSQYNSRPRSAEVLVNRNKWSVIRDRETLEDLVRGEHIPADL